MSDTFGGPIAGPFETSLPRLTLAEIDTLRGICIKAIREGVDANLASSFEGKATSAQKFEAYSRFVPQYVTYSTLSNYLFSAEGAATALRLSLAKAGKSKDDVEAYVGKLAVDTLIDLGRRVALGDAESFLIQRESA